MATSVRPGIALALISGVLVVLGLLIGLSNTGGTYDSESFECGRPFWMVPDQGYSGTEEHDECLQTRRDKVMIAGSLIVLGAAALAAPTWLARRNGEVRQQM